MLPWFVFLLPITLVALWATKTLFVPSVRTYKCAAQVRGLLSPPDVSLESLLSSRALPNQRLVHAFGLTNTFVSGDTKVHRTFTAKAKTLIATTGEKGRTWSAVAQSAEATAHQFLPVQRKIEFATYIQCITFAVVLSTMFNTDLDTLLYDDVVCVTDIINRRWTDSKIKDAAAMCQDDSLQRMMSHLDRWIVDRDQSNPLNFILPAYETMWRVVATTVAHFYCSRDNMLQDVMLEFGREPTEEHFQAFGEDGQQPSMQAIISEVLRLHPPTRHISRAPVGPGSWWHTLFAPRPVVEIADIEAVHLLDDYGENTSRFDPMRFHPSRMSGRGELYSFGYGRLKCVAAAWAPMAAAIIATKVILQIEEAGCNVLTGPEIGRRSGWDGWEVRRETE